MKPKESEENPEGKKADPKGKEGPEVYAIQRGRSGWTLSRRSLFSAAAAAAAAPERARAAVCATGAAAHTQEVQSVAISPDGRTLASGSQDNTIKLWSLPDGALLKTLTGHRGLVSSIAISPDGRLLASGSDDMTIMLWSLPDGKVLKTLTGDTHYVSSVAISPDGRLLVTASQDYKIKLWSLPDATLLKTLAANWAVNSVAISPDGRLLASNDSRVTIKLWSLPDGKQLPVCLMDPAASASSVGSIRYTVAGVTYTVPSGSPMPSGAVCTCNLVQGSVSPGGGGGTYWYPN